MELKGTYPKIFENERYGSEAKKIYNDANALLDRVIKDNIIKAHAIIGLFPANAVNEDVEVFADEHRSSKISTFHFMRQQTQKQQNTPNLCLADYIAPKESGAKDYIGTFAVTTGIGIEHYIEEFKKDNDDYNDIMIKAVTDRLAEAFAELMHAKVRKELWGFCKDETLNNEDLILEKYQGIRPAPGYAACPEHTEKRIIWDLMKVEETIGISLTESYAMFPAASVSGYYFANPESKYIGVGKVSKDQVADLAARKNMPVDVLEKWLAVNLNYDI
ncbi:MAG: hypothetical protein IPK03_14175 [Bacteroidetes bacterium]|nr:hypothetical protein [Bacteroidota bacterium]